MVWQKSAGPEGGYCHTKAVGVCHQSPMEHMEKEIKKFMVTKRELLNNLSNIYKCKERFHWEISSSMKERIIRFNWGTKRENLHFFFGQREKWPKTGAFARHIHVYLSIGSTPPGAGLSIEGTGVHLLLLRS